MKVLLINGSPRKNGNTFTALSEIAKTLQAEGIESEIVWIGNKPVRGCIACGTCKMKNDGRCVFDDDVCNSISAQFAESDGFVFASPVYYGQPNGALLAIMQRAFFSNADDEHAARHFAVLEHRVRSRGRASRARYGRYADHAYARS